VLLGVVYRPPKIKFIKWLEEFLSPHVPKYDHVILAGDFNCNWLVDSSEKTKLNAMLGTGASFAPLGGGATAPPKSFALCPL